MSSPNLNRESFKIKSSEPYWQINLKPLVALGFSFVLPYALTLPLSPVAVGRKKSDYRLGHANLCLRVEIIFYF